MEAITDYITGKEIDIVGPEISRQKFEKFLVETKGYEKTDIKVDVPILVRFKKEDYPSVIDLIVHCHDTAVMAITCVAGSIGSYEREILAGARLVYDYQIPLAVSTDAIDAVVMDSITGKTVGKGLDTIPSKQDAQKILAATTLSPIEEGRVEREMIIYRSFNLEKVNR